MGFWVNDIVIYQIVFMFRMKMKIFSQVLRNLYSSFASDVTSLYEPIIQRKFDTMLIVRNTNESPLKKVSFLEMLNNYYRN